MPSKMVKSKMKSNNKGEATPPHQQQNTMNEKTYIATFSLKWGDVCERSYKSKSAALRAIRNAYQRYEGCGPFIATMEVFDKENHKVTLLLDIWGENVLLNRLKEG